MRIVYFSHAITSCWNHGNAHFQRGLLRELSALGHDVTAFEPVDSWSRKNLVDDHGRAPLQWFNDAFPDVRVQQYAWPCEVDSLLHAAHLVVIHEWTDPALVAAIGRYARNRSGLSLFFHDTHHRAVSDPLTMSKYDLTGYDGILAFGQSLADHYARRGWGNRAFVFHEAADTSVFTPPPDESAIRNGAIWVGNWGDGERTEEIEKYLLRPAFENGIPLDIYGVRYPHEAQHRLNEYGARYNGWIANVHVPNVFARHTFTVHIPRRFYTSVLPGIPTIRVFEALACGIPLISAPWSDTEGIFRVGTDLLSVKDEAEMRRTMRDVLQDPFLAQHLRRNGPKRISQGHTCRHRAEQLLAIAASIAPAAVRAQI